MNTAPLIVVNILRDVVMAVDNVLFPTLQKHIFYYHGRPIQILQKLQQLNDGVASKGTKYPLFAVFQDFPEQTGQGYDLIVKLPKISISCLTNLTDEPPDRYPKTFEPILYPIWAEFLNQLCKHPNIVGNDPRAFKSMKFDRPGTQPDKGSMNDYVDAIELDNLELTFQRSKKCS